MEDRKRVGRDIQKVEFGWPLGMPYCRKPRRWPLGGAMQPSRRKNWAGGFLRRARADGATTWVYQENVEDSRSGFETRAQAHEGGALR